jgi:hypothetical protein
MKIQSILSLMLLTLPSLAGGTSLQLEELCGTFDLVRGAWTTPALRADDSSILALLDAQTEEAKASIATLVRENQKSDICVRGFSQSQGWFSVISVRSR